MPLTMDENVQLASSYLAFAHALLGRLRAHAVATPPPRYLAPYIVFEEEGTFSPGCAERTVNLFLFGPAIVDAYAMPELQAFALALRAAGLISFHPTGLDDEPGDEPSFASAQGILVSRLAEPVFDATIQARSLEPSPEQLGESLLRYIPVWRSGPRDQCVVPLLNFQCDAGSVPIGPSLAIVALSPEQKTGIWNSNPLFEMWMTAWTFAGLRCALVGTLEHRQPQAAQETLATIPRVLTALRLLKSGDVGSPIKLIFPDPPSPWHDHGGGRGEGTPNYQVRTSGSTYAFQASELPRLSELITTLGSLSQSGTLAALDVTLRRFNQAYSRDLLEDRVIDLTISLESSLLFGETRSSAESFSRRGAILLTGTRDRASSRRLLKTMYDARSKIVHEGQRLTDKKLIARVRNGIGEDIEPADFVQRCEDIAREIIKAYLPRLTTERSLKALNRALERESFAVLPSIVEPGAQPHSR